MTTTTTSRLSISTSHSEQMIERARHLRAAADRLELEAAFAGGEEPQHLPRWQDLMRDGWHHPTLADSSTAQGLVAYAVACALDGESARARHAAADAVCASPVDTTVSIGASFARAIAWITDGDCSAAYEILASQFAAHRHLASEQYLIATVGVFAEAAARVRKTSAAREVLRQWRPSFKEAPPQARHEFDLASSILDDAHRQSRIEALLADGSARPSLTIARLHLALGMGLRRHRRARESRPHFVIATDLLELLGAKPWLSLAASELRAAGVPNDAATGSEALSPQERTIAQLAAKGLSNREIAEQLFLSPRTVGSHLYRIFPKLGVSSRHNLASHLGAS